MTQVFDASAMVAALLGSSGEAFWCVDQFLEGGDLVAPHLLPMEVADIIRRTEARGAVDPSEAASAVHDLRRFDIELVPFEEVADRAWELRANLTIYDACYVAVAELFDCRLVTLDRKLAKAPGLRCEVVVAPVAAAVSQPS